MKQAKDRKAPALAAEDQGAGNAVTKGLWATRQSDPSPIPMSIRNVFCSALVVKAYGWDVRRFEIPCSVFNAAARISHPR